MLLVVAVRHFDLQEAGKIKESASCMQRVGLSQLLKEYMRVLVERIEMEQRRHGQVLDKAIGRPNHQIYIFLGCTVDCCVIHVCHTAVLGCKTFDTDLIQKRKNSFLLQHHPEHANVVNIL